MCIGIRYSGILHAANPCVFCALWSLVALLPAFTSCECFLSDVLFTYSFLTAPEVNTNSPGNSGTHLHPANSNNFL